MDVKNAKELIDRRKIDLSLKRKRAAKCAALFVRIAGEKLAARKTHSMRFDTGEDRVFKRIKLFERKNNYFCSSLLKKYENFTNSGLPQQKYENYCPDGLDFGPVRLDKTCDNYIITQKMFLGGFGEYMDSNNVDGIYRSPSEILSVKNRFNLFQKQVELTGNSRGNANVKYGWLACSWQAAKELLSHGFRDSLMAKLKHTMYGGGVVFGPSNCSRLSACNSDVDENGLHHLVLCRIIMGNMEVVCSDSQFQATSENFDSGVDSVENPKLYVVWNNKVNTHIFPEYTVSFRMCQHDKEMLVGDGSKSGMSVITSSAQLERTYCRLDSISSPAKKMEEYSLQRDSLKNPNVPASPWVPFPMLFAAISNKISCKDKELVDRYYNDYQRKKLSRMELIKHLRIVVGDNILKSTIMCLHKTSVTCRKPVQKMKLVTDLIT